MHTLRRALHAMIHPFARSWPKAAAAILVASSVAAAQEVCLKGYEGATTSISTFVAQQSIGEAEYRQYCQADGTVNKTRFDASGTTLIGLAPVISSFSGSNDYEKTRSFCDQYHRQYASSLSVSSYERSIALEALKSFNSCVALFVDQKLTVEYNVVPRNTFNLSVALPAAKTVTLNGVAFDPQELNCQFSSGRPGAKVEVLKTGQAARKLEDDFVINCRRTAHQVSGRSEFRPVELSLTLNGRQYAFWSPADGVLDFSSSLQQRTREANYQATVKALQGQVSSLQTQLQDTKTQMSLMRPVIVAATSDPGVLGTVGFVGQGQLHVQYDVAFAPISGIDGEAARLANIMCQPLRATRAMNPYAVRGGVYGLHQFVYLCAP